MTTTGLPGSVCPACGAHLTAATGIRDGTIPSPGDVSLCIECGTVLQFDDALHLRLVDLWTLPAEIQQTLLQGQALIRERQRRH